MELNWSTFLLEIINFLILVWILKRFLYKPVRDVIERRREEIDKRFADAEAVRTKAEQMEKQYANRLLEWEQEKQRAGELARQEMDQERRRRLEALSIELGEERKKSEVLLEREQATSKRAAEREAISLGAAFTAKLLSRLAEEHLQDRLLDMLLTDLAELPSEQSAALRATYSGNPAEVRIASAYKLSEAQRSRLQDALNALLAKPVTIEFTKDQSLLAGLRVDLGAHAVQANLRDELRFFAESVDGES